MIFIETILNHPLAYNIIQLLLSMDFYQTVTPLIEAYPHGSILEIGCGTGELLKFLHCNRYVGIDVNKTYFDYATEHFGNKKRTFMLLDAKKMSRSPETFDLVLMINMIHHLSDANFSAILKRLSTHIRFRRLIIIDSKPDIGIFNSILMKADGGDYFREIEAIQKIVEKYFVIETKTIIRKPYWIYKEPMVVVKK